MEPSGVTNHCHGVYGGSRRFFWGEEGKPWSEKEPRAKTGRGYPQMVGPRGGKTKGKYNYGSAGPGGKKGTEFSVFRGDNTRERKKTKK